MASRIKHDHELIRKMKFDQGKTATQIARELGAPVNSISQIIRDCPEYRYGGRGPSGYVWVPEDGIIDPVAVRRAVEDQWCPVRVTRTEALEVMKILVPRGVSNASIARRIGASETTVANLLDELNQEDAA